MLALWDSMVIEVDEQTHKQKDRKYQYGWMNKHTQKMDIYGWTNKHTNKRTDPQIFANFVLVYVHDLLTVSRNYIKSGLKKIGHMFCFIT